MRNGVRLYEADVIIGNGVAAIGCIEGIRKIDTYSKIVVVSEENTRFTAASYLILSWKKTDPGE